MREIKDQLTLSKASIGRKSEASSAEYILDITLMKIHEHGHRTRCELKESC